MTVKIDSPHPPAGTHSEVRSERPWAIKTLPPFPAVALQLMSLLGDADAPMKQIVSLLRVDPALSAEVLRVSNSALYGLSRRIDNVSHAVVVLGSEVVKRLALTVALGRFSQRFLRNQGLRICWDHSVATALIAEQLAEELNRPRDRAYTAGLLHDLGRLALLACYPDEYANMLEVARENDYHELECERHLFDIDHCAAGEWLARHWNLPEDIVTAISKHHEMQPNDASLPAIVAASLRLADAMGYQVVQRPKTATIEEIVAQLPLANPAETAARIRSREEQVRTAIATVTPTHR